MLPQTKKDALRRMKIIKGQIENVIEMIEDETYCQKTMIQILAIEKALKQVEAKLLEGHIQTCIKKQLASGKTKQATAELLELFQLSKK